MTTTTLRPWTLRHLTFSEFTDVRFASRPGPFDVTMATAHGQVPLRLWLRCVTTGTKWECTVDDTAATAAGKVFVWASCRVIQELEVALRFTGQEGLSPLDTGLDLDVVTTDAAAEPSMVLTIDPNSPLESTYTFPLVRSAVAPIALLQDAVSKLERENQVLHRAVESPSAPISLVATSKVKVPRDTFLTWSVVGWLDPSQFALTALSDAVVLAQPGKYCLTVRGHFEQRHGHNAIVLFVNGVAVVAPPGNKAVDTVDVAHVMDVAANAYVQVLHRGGNHMKAGATLGLYWLAPPGAASAE